VKECLDILGRPHAAMIKEPVEQAHIRRRTGGHPDLHRRPY